METMHPDTFEKLLAKLSDPTSPTYVQGSRMALENARAQGVLNDEQAARFAEAVRELDAPPLLQPQPARPKFG